MSEIEEELIGDDLDYEYELDEEQEAALLNSQEAGEEIVQEDVVEETDVSADIIGEYDEYQGQSHYEEQQGQSHYEDQQGQSHYEEQIIESPEEKEEIIASSHEMVIGGGVEVEEEEDEEDDDEEEDKEGEGRSRDRFRSERSQMGMTSTRPKGQLPIPDSLDKVSIKQSDLKMNVRRGRGMKKGFQNQGDRRYGGPNRPQNRPPFPYGMDNNRPMMFRPPDSRPQMMPPFGSPMRGGRPPHFLHGPPRHPAGPDLFSRGFNRPPLLQEPSTHFFTDEWNVPQASYLDFASDNVIFSANMMRNILPPQNVANHIQINRMQPIVLPKQPNFQPPVNKINSQQQQHQQSPQGLLPTPVNPKGSAKSRLFRPKPQPPAVQSPPNKIVNTSNPNLKTIQTVEDKPIITVDVKPVKSVAVKPVIAVQKKQIATTLVSEGNSGEPDYLKKMEEQKKKREDFLKTKERKRQEIIAKAAKDSPNKAGAENEGKAKVMLTENEGKAKVTNQKQPMPPQANVKPRIVPKFSKPIQRGSGGAAMRQQRPMFPNPRPLLQRAPQQAFSPLSNIPPYRNPFRNFNQASGPPPNVDRPFHPPPHIPPLHRPPPPAATFSDFQSPPPIHSRRPPLSSPLPPRLNLSLPPPMPPIHPTAPVPDTSIPPPPQFHANTYDSGYNNYDNRPYSQDRYPKRDYSQSSSNYQDDYYSQSSYDDQYYNTSRESESFSTCSPEYQDISSMGKPPLQQQPSYQFDNNNPKTNFANTDLRAGLRKTQFSKKVASETSEFIQTSTSTANKYFPEKKRNIKKFKQLTRSKNGEVIMVLKVLMDDKGNEIGPKIVIYNKEEESRNKNMSMLIEGPTSVPAVNRMKEIVHSSNLKTLSPHIKPIQPSTEDYTPLSVRLDKAQRLMAQKRKFDEENDSYHAESRRYRVQPRMSENLIPLSSRTVIPAPRRESNFFSSQNKFPSHFYQSH